MGPVRSQSRHNMAHDIWASDRAIDIRDDEFRARRVEVQFADHLLLALEGRADQEFDIVLTHFQV